MKRELIQNVKVIPYTNGDAIDREGFLSAVCAVKAAAAGDMTVALTHSDTATGDFVAVPDTCKFVGGGASATGLKAADIANFDIDLVGCKQFVKLTVSGAAATVAEGATLGCSLVLGDPAQAPV